MVVLETGYGFWSPIVWVIAIAVVSLVAYIIWSLGEKEYRKDTEQTRPFISGNPEPAKGMVHIRAGNLYWGFTEALKGYYDWLVPAHTGIVNDYVLWFLGIMAVIMLIIGLVP
jgi:hypothetical protein